MSGRMGRLVADAVIQAGATVAGGTVRGGQAQSGLPIFPDAPALARACDVLVDFSSAAAIPVHADAVRETGIAWVLGTTGLSPSDDDAVQAAAERSTVVQAANFSPGVNLVLALARHLARALPASEYDAEILEMHHRNKTDAPSGTALALGRAVAEARGVALQDVAESARSTRSGARSPGAIGFASLRGGQVVGEHTLIFAGDAEHISLSHSAFDRSVFARGAVRAAFWAVQSRPPGLYSMLDVLGMTEDLEGGVSLT